MRIFPLVLIAVGVYGVLRHYGLIDPELLGLLWPVLLIAIGAALLARGPRWRGDWRDRVQDRWERRMHRHFGPGWANLSDEERERFRAGMHQWQSRWHGDAGGGPPASRAPGGDGFPKPPAQPPAPGEQR